MHPTNTSLPNHTTPFFIPSQPFPNVSTCSWSPPCQGPPHHPHSYPFSCIPNVHPSPACALSGLQGWGWTGGCCPCTCRWGSFPPSRSHPLQLCSHWPRSAPGSSGGTGGPVTPTAPALPLWGSQDAPAQHSLLLPSLSRLGQQGSNTGMGQGGQRGALEQPVPWR